MNSELSYESQPQFDTPIVQPKPQNHFSRIFGVLFSPGETFQEIGRAPRVLIPMLLLALLGAAMSYAITNRIGYENVVRKQSEPMMRAMSVPEDKIEEEIKNATTGTRATIGKIQGPISAAIVFVAMLFIVAGVFKLFTMMMGANNRFKPVLSVVTYAYLAIYMVQVVVTLISIYLKNPEEIDMLNPVGSNLGALLSLIGSGMPKFLTALASWVDVFGIWRIVLLGIGCAAVTPKMKAGTAAIPHIVLYILMALALSSLASMMG